MAASTRVCVALNFVVRSGTNGASAAQRRHSLAQRESLCENSRYQIAVEWQLHILAAQRRPTEAHGASHGSELVSAGKAEVENGTQLRHRLYEAF